MKIRVVWAKAVYVDRRTDMTKIKESLFTMPRALWKCQRLTKDKSLLSRTSVTVKRLETARRLWTQRPTELHLVDCQFALVAFYCFGINPLNAKLNLICHFLILLGAHHILHVSRIRVETADQISTTGDSLPSCFSSVETNIKRGLRLP
jgi:hypothetical protein